MAATFGKLERLIEVPTGSWTFTLSEDNLDVGTVTLTAADTFYWSSAGSAARLANGASASSLKTALEAVGAGTYSVFLNDGEGDTGKLQITVSGGASVWGMHTFQENGAANNALRDLMGFAADITTDVASATSDNHVQGLWLPDAPFFWHRGSADYGSYETDMVTTESPAGHVKAFYSQKKRVFKPRWRAISKARAYTASESDANESFQTFWVNDVLGEKGYAAQPAGPVRWYPDASVDGTYETYKIPLTEDIGELMTEDWIELVNITIPRMVVVPS